MKRLVDTFWVVVLVIAVGGVVGGFLGGRSIGRASVGNRGRQSARMPVPDAIVAGHFERVLSGPHSLDMADPDTSAPLGDVVAARPRGWAPAFTPYLHARSKLALVLLECGRSSIREFRSRSLAIQRVILPANWSSARTQTGRRCSSLSNRAT
jgi:hypothetical protein